VAVCGSKFAGCASRRFDFRRCFYLGSNWVKLEAMFGERVRLKWGEIF
jgi:hypothetical protein